MNVNDYDDEREVDYDDFAADQYRRSTSTPTRCPNYRASYCMAHDYDHVLERRENAIDGGPLTYVTRLGDDFNARWAEYKNEFAEREREQEAAAYESKMRRDERLGWTR